jgi:hypothetical protein
MSTKNVTGKCAVKNCGKAYTEWNYNTIGSDKNCDHIMVGRKVSEISEMQ